MDILTNCTLCPHKCNRNRANGERGFCGASSTLRLYRYGPHFGEEPPITGEKGSGTLFFSHCTLSCIFCQNYPWSQEHQGEDITIERLAEIMISLKEQGCHNWNLVTPTPWLPLIRKAAKIAIEKAGRLPFVYNTSGFERIETLAKYTDLCDIALTDLRYSTPELAARYSGNGEYVTAARDALKYFCTHLGPLDNTELATRGVICRLLVLPGHPQEAIDNLRWIADNIGPELDISLMSQYTPLYKALADKDFSRRITEEEYKLVTDEAERLGFENGWIQPYEEAASDCLVGSEMGKGEGTVK